MARLSQANRKNSPLKMLFDTIKVAHLSENVSLRNLNERPEAKRKTTPKRHLV